MDLGDDVIQMINISSGTLEACLKTYIIKQSSRHKKETEPDARIAKKQSNGESAKVHMASDQLYIGIGPII